MNRKQTGFNLGYALLAALGVMFLQDWWVHSQAVVTLPYSDFQKLVREDKIAKVVVGQDRLSGDFKEPIQGKKRFVAVRVDADIAKELDAHGVSYAGEYESNFLPMLLSWVVPIGLFAALWIFAGRRMAKQLGGPGGGLLSVGKSKAKVYVETDTKVTFADVAGVDEAKAELKEIVSFLTAPKDYGRLGARMPKGVLLVGPPGTGKTLLARAVAGEAGVPFFSISGSEFVEMFVGVGAARVRDLFEQARAKAPCIIFIDELDALGRARASMPGLGGHDEKEQTLNQLLVEMDGFDPSAGLVLLAATNRPEILDPALLRAGRFDRQVLVDRPDRLGRAEILRVHTRKVVLAPDVKLDDVAALTPGFTGADLANLVNEAALAATRRGAAEIAMVDFNTAVERIVAGLEKKNRLLNPREREIVAHHELGHALVAAALPGSDPVHKISIIPRGIGALGYTIQRPTEDRFLMTREELDGKMAVLLGGRAAEDLVYGHLSTGAADDLSKATDIARSMVTRFGMGGTLGPVSYEREPQTYLGQPFGRERLYAEATAREIDVAVRGLVEGQLERAREVLTANRALLEEAARTLLAKESLAGAELEAVLGRVARLPVPDLHLVRRP
ncbi:ATP-dependent zinc metalloprotease FtsH [Anaeromyxobacter diazotrophicus]|uniref:ATP-dependent zinc metalloprotease FtsH n=1 Tax=Anaeromyxobacter diazotrophicus TaxID=2590199 RepID=A0A7I9VJY4_9BACT|nr:ATP-dependent zinc metalloprotease FtsH [Anaeromyxobacter diazotrophicus]GEJ56716.1 ATP-dependent zinc metalloprotease FtsH [Anaeromyxobacter diazotrophicus]